VGGVGISDGIVASKNTFISDGIKFSSCILLLGLKIILSELASKTVIFISPSPVFVESMVLADPK
jgi:hypothetical protein